MTNKNIQASTKLPSYEKVADLPEALRVYTLTMSNKAEYQISGEEKEAIMSVDTNFVQLRSGHIINKAFIVDIFWDKKATIAHYRKNHG